MHVKSNNLDNFEGIHKIIYILYVPLILQQIQISVDQPYAGPGCQLLRYQRDI
jgi:hypothetical protein